MVRRLLIIEDNISYLTSLRMSLEDSELDIHYETTEAGAMVYLSEHTPDLVLLDIMLGNNNSAVHLAKKLARMNVPFIVMTQHRDESLYNQITEYRPLAYYIKPIDLVSLKYTMSQIEPLESRTAPLHHRDDGKGIFVKWKSKIVRVPFNDIRYMQGEGNYLTIHATQSKKYVVRKSLRQLCVELENEEFIRVHRNYVININKISSFDLKEGRIIIRDVIIPVGRSFKSNVKKRLSSYS